jgi:hypothetical protein
VSGELEPRVLEGRVITGGVAQSTTREGDVTRVRLTVFGGLAPQLDYETMAAGGPVCVPFPEPVQAGAGETIVLEVEWRPGPAVTQELRGLR